MVLKISVTLAAQRLDR